MHNFQLCYYILSFFVVYFEGSMDGFILTKNNVVISAENLDFYQDKYIDFTRENPDKALSIEEWASTVFEPESESKDSSTIQSDETVVIENNENEKEERRSSRRERKEEKDENVVEADVRPLSEFKNAKRGEDPAPSLHWKNMVSSFESDKNGEGSDGKEINDLLKKMKVNDSISSNRKTSDIPVIEARVKKSSRRSKPKKMGGVCNDVNSNDDIPVIESSWKSDKNKKNKEENIEVIEASWNNDKTKKEKNNEDGVEVIEAAWGKEKKKKSMEPISKETTKDAIVEKGTPQEGKLESSLNFICKHAKSVMEISNYLNSASSMKKLAIALSKVNLLQEGSVDESLEKLLAIESFTSNRDKLMKAKEKVNHLISVMITNDENMHSTLKRKFIEVADERYAKGDSKIKAFTSFAKNTLGAALAYYAIDAHKNGINNVDTNADAADIVTSLLKAKKLDDTEKIVLCWIYGSFCRVLINKVGFLISRDIFEIKESSIELITVEKAVTIDSRFLRKRAKGQIKNRTVEYVIGIAKRNNDEYYVKSQAEQLMQETIRYFDKKNTPALSHLLSLCYGILAWLRPKVTTAASELDSLTEMISNMRPKNTGSTVSDLCTAMVSSAVDILSRGKYNDRFTLLLPKNADLHEDAISHLLSKQSSIDSLVKNHLIKGDIRKAAHLKTFNAKDAIFSEGKMKVGESVYEVGNLEKKWKDGQKDKKFTLQIHHINNLL
jgi:hypothetical protein